MVLLLQKEGQAPNEHLIPEGNKHSIVTKAENIKKEMKTNTEKLHLTYLTKLGKLFSGNWCLRVISGGTIQP